MKTLAYRIRFGVVLCGTLISSALAMHCAVAVDDQPGGENAGAGGAVAPVEEPAETGAAAQADTGQSCEVSDCGIIHKTGCHISCATGHAPHCSCDCIDRWLGICVKKDDRCYCE